MSLVCLIETGWTYIGPKIKYFDLDGTEDEDFLEEFTAENTQDCATYAYYNVSKVDSGTSKPVYWTYEPDEKLCSVVLHKLYRKEAKGLMSGSSHCQIDPGSNFENSLLTLSSIVSNSN